MTFSWPFYPDASSYCLDTFNPLEGDQNLPSFPLYANNYTNIDISSVKPVKLNAANPASNSTVASATLSSFSQSSTSSPSSSSSENGSLYTAPLPSSLTSLLLVVMVVSVSYL